MGKNWSGRQERLICVPGKIRAGDTGPELGGDGKTLDGLEKAELFVFSAKENDRTFKKE